MAAPDYVLCLECESPVYEFEWKDDKLSEALCVTCGNDELTQFATEEEFEALAMAHYSANPGAE